MRRRIAASVLATAIAAVAGCAPVAPDSDVVAAISPVASEIMLMARITGTVVLGDGGCFSLATDAGTLPILFPHGSQLDTGVPAVRMPDGETLGVGDAVDTGGGYVGLGDIEVPEACVRDQVVALNP